MSWNYRIVRHPCGSLVLHEVYYTKKGKVKYLTDTGATFACDAEEGADGIIQSLALAVRDAAKYPVLDHPFLPKRD